MSKSEFMQSVSGVEDPYQAFFDFLVEKEGVSPAIAWDRVFEDCPDTIDMFEMQ